jgi:hypothetical protein
MKLTPLTIFLIGISLAVIFITYGLFQAWIPNQRDAATFRSWGEKLDAEGAKMSAAKNRVKKAEEAVKLAESSWVRTVARRTPPASVEAGGINLAVDRYNLTVDARRFRNNIQNAVNRQLKSGGVTVVQGPSVPFPSEDPATLLSTYFNYPDREQPVCIFDLGQVTVRGTFEQISNNIRSWSNMPGYLAVADGLAISGTSPNLTGTYNLTIVAFIRGKRVSPDLPAGSGGVAGAAPGVPGPGGAGAPRFGGGGPAGGFSTAAGGRDAER